jgi:hypothetical protein
MFDRIADLAERVATQVSRRHFLGSLGRWAGATALAMAGAFATVGVAWADGGKTCCEYGDLTGNCYCKACVPLGTPCPPSPCNAGISFAPQTVGNCGDCQCPKGHGKSNGG